MGQCRQLNPVCGDEITRGMETAEDEMTGIHWARDGRSISMASGSIFSDTVVGLNRAEVAALIVRFREVVRFRGKLVADEEIRGDIAAL